jgi:putative peptidoglycan lipid II flippase
MPDTQRQLSRFMAIFAGGTMISRVLGLARDVVTAAVIPTVFRDAFLFAFRLPNMLRDMLGEGATNAAFVPVLAEAREKGSEADFRALIGGLYSAMVLVLGLITVAGVLVMPALPWVLDLLRPLTGAEPKDAGQLATTIRLMQWTFPYLFFIGLAAFAMGPLFTVRHYGTPSWSPALLNVAIIVFALLLYRRMENPAWALVIGVWAGGIAQAAVLLRAMKRHTGVLWPSFHIGLPGVRRAGWLLLPIIFGQAAGEVNKLVDNFFAYSLEEGTVTALFYANRLVQLPLSIFGVAVSVAILPEIARAAARKETGAVRETLLHGYRQTLFLVLPAMCGLVVLREPIMRLLFERGEFSPEETAMGASALLYYGLGLLSFVWVKVSVQGFYAQQDTRTPVIISAASMLLNILLNCALVGPFGFRGLAFATTVSFTVNFALLYLFLNARVGTLWDRATADTAGRVILATVAACALAYGVTRRIELHFGTAGLAVQALAVMLPVALAAAAYLGLARALRIGELDHLLGIFRRGK